MTMKVVDIDKNLTVTWKVNRPGIVYYDATSEPFRLFGLFTDENGYYRVPTDVAAATSANILEMHRYTTGGRIRFVTNSPYVAVHVKLREPYATPQMPLLSTHGFDVYDKNVFKGSLIPPLNIEDDTYEALLNLGEREEHTVTVNLPLYTNIDTLLIGLDETSYVTEAPDYTYTRPIVFYGSSITNGCASPRPGLTYESIICRRFDADHINLGFGGSARAELPMAEYVASLDMSIFVYDYDHNAPTPKYLSETHERMFKIFREKHPDTPVIMASRPRSTRTEDTDLRFEIIKQTYDNALADGDKNVYLINGIDFTEGLGSDWSLDGVHPSDACFRKMAEIIGDVIERIIK